MDKSDSMEHLPDVIAHKGDIAFHGGELDPVGAGASGNAAKRQFPRVNSKMDNAA